MFILTFYKYLKVLEFLDNIQQRNITEIEKYNLVLRYLARSKIKTIHHEQNIIEIKISCLFSINVQYIDGMFIYEAI